MKKTIVLLVCFSIVACATYSGRSIGVTYSSHGPYNFIGGGGTNTVEVRLNFDAPNFVQSVLMHVKTTNTPPNYSQFDINFYQHKNPNSSSKYDLQNANLGQIQTVNIGGLKPGDNIYIFVVNLVLRGITQYKIFVTERVGYNREYCAVGNPLANDSIYCSSCVNNLTYGSFCDITVVPLSTTINYQMILGAWNTTLRNYVSVTIPASNRTAILHYSLTAESIVMIVQSKIFSFDVAGLLNKPYGGLQFINKTNNYQFQYPIISDGNNDISVFFMNPNPQQTILNIWYQFQSQKNILPIVLGVIGAVVFVILVIVMIVIAYNRRRTSSQQFQNNMIHQYGIHPASEPAILMPVHPARIDIQDVQTYFPAVLCKYVINEEQPSSDNLNSDIEKSSVRDCAICLSGILSTDMIKVAYCRHIFHAQCLNKWFEKHKNCPYCRQEYNSKTTMEHYRTLLNLAHKNKLAGIELANCILSSKLHSHQIIEQLKE